MLERVVPNESCGRISEWVVAKSVAAAEPAKGLFQMIGIVAFRAPGMPIRRVDAVAIKVVEQHKSLGQGVVIGRNKLRINTEAGIAISLRHVAKHLVVSFVLF